MIASSTTRPWSDVVAGATNYLAVAKSEPYPFHSFGSGSDSQRQDNENQMMNLFGTYSLLYVLNSDNSGSITWRSSITALMDKWPQTRADQPVADGYNQAVPLNSAFMAMTIALDLIHDDLTAVQISSYEVMMDSWVSYSRGQSSSWALNNYGAYMTYSLYRDTSTAQVIVDTTCYHVNILQNYSVYPPAVCGQRQAYPNLSSEINGSQLNSQGINNSGSSYAWARIGGSSREKMGKWGGSRVAVFTGADTSYTSSSLMSNFYEWLFAAQTTPWNSKVVFGDTANNQDIGSDSFQGLGTIYTNGFFLMKNAHLVAGQYSAKAQKLANRAVNTSTVTVVYPGELIDYVSITSSDTSSSQAVTSVVFTKGGAAFWDEDQSTQALQGVYNNGHITRNDHYHASDFNGLFLAGYGETLLSNVGVGSTIGGTILGFPGRYYESDAHSGNTALIGNRNYAQDVGLSSRLDNSFTNWNPAVTGNPSGGMYIGNPSSIPLYGGDGIQEYILGGGFDYAQGIATSPYVFRDTTTGAVTTTLGENKRSFFFVHPDTEAINANGYWFVSDEMTSSTKAPVNVLWHPYGTVASTTSLNEEYSWLVSTRAGVTNTYLNLYLATTPSAVSFSSSPFSGTPSSFVGSYINSSYAVDSSSNARILTVLFPENPSHLKATMNRFVPVGATGALISNGTSTDFILVSTPSATVLTGSGIYKGRLAYIHYVAAILSSYFIRQGTYFDDENSPRTGFSSTSPVSIYMRGAGGSIYLPSATSVTFYFPGIVGMSIDSSPVAGAAGANSYTVSISSGGHDISFSTAVSPPMNLRGTFKAKGRTVFK